MRTQNFTLHLISVGVSFKLELICESLGLNMI